MSEFQLPAIPKEKDAEELFNEIDKINKNYRSFDIFEIKNILFKIKNEYIWNYKNIFLSKEKEIE